MSLPNTARGEFALELDGEKAVVVADMQRLIQFSAAIGATSLREVHTRLTGADPVAMSLFLEAFVKDGDVRALKANMRYFTDLAAVSKVALQVLLALQGPPAKNA
jgi:hypothetical protein